MKTIIIAFFVALCNAPNNLAVLSPNFIREIQKTKPLWTASAGNFPPYYDMETLRRISSGALVPDSPKELSTVSEFSESSTPLPKEFDARKAWPDCKSIQQIRNQGACGSCWAFSSVSTMSDRHCIRTGENFEFSPEDLIENCRACLGNRNDICGGGGGPWTAMQYWSQTGLVSGSDAGLVSDSISDRAKQGCKPYRQDVFQNGTNPFPTKSCSNAFYLVSYEKDKRYGKDAFQVRSVNTIKREIMENGPVSVTYYIFEDFWAYKSGIYHHVTGNYVGAHACKIIGWGESDDGIPYWIVANSWGTLWGESGYFRMMIGDKYCQFETWIFAGTAYNNESFLTLWVIEPIIHRLKSLFGLFGGYNYI